MNSSSEKTTVCISIDFCHQLRKTSGRIKWAILVPFHICPLPEKPPVVFTPNEFEFGKGRPSFFRWVIPSRPDFKYYYVLILNPIFTSQFISDMLRRSFLTKHPDQLFYLVYLYFGKRQFYKAHNADSFARAIRLFYLEIMNYLKIYISRSGSIAPYSMRLRCSSKHFIRS